MDAEALHNTLAGINVTPPDELRASLYLTQIQDTRTFLFTTLANDQVIGGDVYQKFAPALQDPELLNDFCVIIDHFLGAAVSADLMQPPAPFTDYANYFDVNIFQANAGVFATNVTQFYGRRPATWRAVQALTTNFQNNIRTACQRIQNNWADIQATFAPSGELRRLRKIKSSGSDFHKGGQQVLILTFEMFAVATPDDAGSTDAVRVVYKPSDLEVDCLIAGNSAAVNAVHDQFQTSSLFEIINTLIATARTNNPQLQDLPTYKILPYNRGSLLNANNAGQLPIGTSYGYIQFLEHRHDPGKSIFNYYPFGASDFKIFPKQDAVAIARQFYQLVGQLVAVACTFSILDMHIENIIVSQYVAHLIDLEICLIRSIDNVANTAMFGNKGGITGVTLDGPDFNWVQRVTRVKGQNVLDLVRDMKQGEKQNRLWTMEPLAVVNPSASGCANSLFQGFLDGFFVMGRGAAGNEMAAWFQRLDNTVVRYIPYGTGDFTQVMTDIYFDADNVSTANFYQARLLEFLTIKYRAYGQAPTPEPNFVALQTLYTEQDYLNCDIPVFYHRIGSTGIMDSRGSPIGVPATITVLNNENQQVQVQVQGPLGRDSYFAAAPTQPNVQAGQLAILTNGAEARFNALRPSMLRELGLDAVPNASQVIR